MRGVEYSNGIRYYYQYKLNGPRYYYTKPGRKWPTKPVEQPRQRRPQQQQQQQQHQPKVPISKIEAIYKLMPEAVRSLISTWLLVFGFISIKDVTLEAVSKGFRRLAIIHHPDRGGTEENFKQLGSVRDHLVTLCTLAG